MLNVIMLSVIMAIHTFGAHLLTFWPKQHLVEVTFSQRRIFFLILAHKEPCSAIFASLDQLLLTIQTYFTFLQNKLA
jgi:hypothetical protein